uniref:Protoporphyrinogen oxidase n=2 Tax=Lygus hesperus TaxID=30085 RepID=A0A0A9X5D7_LYGHE
MLLQMLCKSTQTVPVSGGAVLQDDQLPLFTSMKRSGLVSIHGGMQSVITALSNSLTVGAGGSDSVRMRVMLQTKVTSLLPTSTGAANVRVVWQTSDQLEQATEFDHVYCTVSSPNLMRLLVSTHVPSSTLHLLNSISHTSLWVVNVVAHTAAVLKVNTPGFGALFPTATVFPPNQLYSCLDSQDSRLRASKHPLYGLLGITFDSDTFPTLYTHSNGSKSLVMTLMFGGDRFPELAEESSSDIERRARTCLQFLFQQSAETMYAKLCRDCIVQFHPMHSTIVNTLRHHLALLFPHPNVEKPTALAPLQVFGNCYDSPALADSIRTAHRHAVDLTRSLVRASVL